MWNGALLVLTLASAEDGPQVSWFNGHILTSRPRRDCEGSVAGIGLAAGSSADLTVDDECDLGPGCEEAHARAPNRDSVSEPLPYRRPAPSPARRGPPAVATPRDGDEELPRPGVLLDGARLGGP